MSNDGDDEYAFRVPFASTIYRRATFDETFTALLDSKKSCPVEILLLINKEVHASPNQTYEEIHSNWTAVTHKSAPTGHGSHTSSLVFDKDNKTYIISESKDYHSIWDSVSASDMLYRMRCFFPDVYICSQDAYKSVWTVSVRHKPSGIILGFGEHKGALIVHATYDDHSEVEEQSEVGKAFTADALRLLNTFFKTVDRKRFAYFHPAADADFSAGDEKYLAVPASISQDRVEESRSSRPYKPWRSMEVSSGDTSSFQSLLPSMMYNIETRKVDAESGSVHLTSVISSSLLFYRLQCYYIRDRVGVNCTPPITSVWQVKLVHRKNGASVVFMDDYGLFDIRAGESAKEVMDDIVALVNALCSDNCTHPYDGLLAGCVD